MRTFLEDKTGSRAQVSFFANLGALAMEFVFGVYGIRVPLIQPTLLVVGFCFFVLGALCYHKTSNWNAFWYFIPALICQIFALVLFINLLKHALASSHLG